MRKWCLLLLVSSFFLLTGATCMEALFPTDPETGGYKPGTGVAGAAGSVGSLWIPWLGTALGAIGSVVGEVRRKRYAAAASSLARGVNVIRSKKDEEGRISFTDEDTLMQIFAAIQDKEATRQIVRKVVHKVEKTVT